MFPLSPSSRPMDVSWKLSLVARFAFGTIGCLFSSWETTSLGQAPAIDPRVAGGEETDAAEAGAYLPTDRTLNRAMSRAAERLADGEYQQALTFLQEILSRDEDAFLDDPSNQGNPAGLKTTARRWIGELPTAGREAYELLKGAAARRELNSALADGSQDAIAQVVRKYFHTKSGYEAAFVLAQMNADEGRYLVAAQLFQELIESPSAAAQLEPQLSVLAALNCLAAGQPDVAAETLRVLFKEHAASTLEIAGHAVTVPGNERDPLAWLSQLTGQSLQTPTVDPNWLTLRGDATRHINPTGGAPHLRARWESRVVNNPSMEALLATRSAHYAHRGVAMIPAAQPIAAGDVVLMRTPQQVVAIDWQTGKRIWETREDESFENEESLSDAEVNGGGDEWTGVKHPFEQRVWEDVLAMSLASDGQRVFVIRGLSVPSQEDGIAWQQVVPFGNGVDVATTATNRLAAYDLASEGKLAWELDGERPTGPLKDAFFLGTPLAIDNTLYVLAEIRSEVYLLAIDPRTGQVEWRQQLVGLEQGIGLDPLRRLAGAMPSYAGGILVCPTSAGTVVAVDVAKREFAWVYRYSRKASTAEDIRNMWQQQAQGHPARLNDRWLDSSAILVDGRVLITPPDSGELHCLDLRRGELLWKRPQGNALFVGGVADGKVLVVGSNSLTAVGLAEGSPAWDDRVIPLPNGTLPSGQGYLSEDRYYLPLSSGNVIAIDVAGGSILNSTATQNNIPLGNLICYRGSVLSQSALVLDKFEQLDLLGQRAEAALAANPNDATAIRELAEMKLAEGGLTEAILLLKHAFELAPEDATIQEMLAEGLIETLKSDFTSFRADLPLARRLLRSREQEIELLRVEASELEKLGERSGAVDACLGLLDLTAGQPIELELGTDYSVRSDRWTNGSLGRLWSEATSDERIAMTEKIQDRRPVLDRDPDADALRYWLTYFDQLPNSDQVRVQLAQYLVENGLGQEAELVLLQLGASKAEEPRAAATALMTRHLVQSGQLDHAAAYAALLAGPWKNVAAIDGVTGQEWLARFMQESTAFKTASRPVWPRGQVSATLHSVSTPVRDRVNRGQLERQVGYRNLRLEQDFGPAPDATQWLITSDSTLLVGRDSLGGEMCQLNIEQNVPARQYRDSSFVQAARLGHLLFVSLNGRILAIESQSGGSGGHVEVLWQAHPLGRFPVARTQGRSRRRADIYAPWSSRKRISGGLDPVVGVIGPATPRGVVVQEQDEVKCLDPLSGETLWSRTGVPIGCELFGDDQIVVAADVDEREARLFSALDGRLLGKRRLPEFPWMLTAGRNVANHFFRGTGPERRLVLKVTDLWTEKVLFEQEFGAQTRLSATEPRFVAVYDPAGRFQFVNIETGAAVIDQQLEEVPKPLLLEAFVESDQLFVMITGQPPPPLHRPIGPDFPLVNGFVYAFRRSTGEPLWPGPAVVRNRGIAIGQPQGIPLLVFADRKMTHNAGVLRLLCLDKTTGQTVYRNDELPDLVGTHFNIRAAQDTSPHVTIEMSARAVQLAMSDRPQPPAPPANDDVETPRAISERGLWGIGRRIGEALQEALQNPTEINPVPDMSKPEETPQVGEPDDNPAGDPVELDDD